MQVIRIPVIWIWGVNWKVGCIPGNVWECEMDTAVTQ